MPKPSAHNARPPVRIAHVIHRLQVGGLENGLVNIINRLPADEFCHAIICLTEATDFANRIIPEVEIVELRKREGKDPGLYWRLFKTFRSLKPDIVHTRNLATLEAQFPAWLAGAGCRIHGLHGWDVHDLTGANPRYLALYRIMDRFIHRYVPLSDDLEKYLSDRVGVTAGKISKICNGVDTDAFYPRQFHSNREFLTRESGPPGLPWALGDYFVIGTVGRLEIVKDQTNLVQAFIQLLRKKPELKNSVRLMVIGEGALRPPIEKMLSDANLGEYVWLAGARNDVPDLMRAMDLFVLPSKAEGISNTILEAMASGLPVVATDVGGNSQLIDEGETGFLVAKEDPAALADAILRYLNSVELTAAQRSIARQRALEQFSLQGMVDRYADLYRNAQS